MSECLERNDVLLEEPIRGVAPQLPDY
jgi:hypothetical protein